MIVNTGNEDDSQLYKTLNEDVQLKPVSSTSNHWDIQMMDGDYVNVTGEESLRNAICIAIMTRYKELDYLPLYENFGCRIHELVKANKSDMVKFEIRVFVNEVLNNMRRVQEVNYVDVTDSDSNEYQVDFCVTSVSDENITGSVVL